MVPGRLSDLPRLGGKFDSLFTNLWIVLTRLASHRDPIARIRHGTVADAQSHDFDRYGQRAKATAEHSPA